MSVITKKSSYRHFKIISYMVVFFSFSAAIIQFNDNYIIIAAIDFSFSLFFLINIHLIYSHNTKIISFIYVGMLFFILLLYIGGIHNTGWLWSLTYSPIVFLLLQRKPALKLVVVYTILLLFILLMQIFFGLSTVYSSYEIFTLLIIHLFNSYLLYIFQEKIDYYNHKLTKANIELKNKISIEVEANERKNKILSIQSKQAQMGEMISMIAHQWRQPLNAISASAIKLKLENDLDIITSKSINNTSVFIQDRTQDMSEIINNFLDYAKPTTKSIDFSIVALIEKTFKVVNTQFSLKGIFITLNYEDEIKDKTIVGIENLLEQVLLNLLFNVRDAFDEQKDIAIKNIYVTVNKDGNITIEDNAGGIPIDAVDKVFNPYFTTKEEGKGTGLGLYMSRKIMRDNFNGDLLYKPVPNGSSFTIVFNNNNDNPLKEEK